MALTSHLISIKILTDFENSIFNYDDINTKILYYAEPITYQLLIMMILTLMLYTLKRTRFSGIDAIFGTVLLIMLWLSGVKFSSASVSYVCFLVPKCLI